MSTNARLLRKSYAMQRMGQAIARAITAPSSSRKAAAARWAAAWGLLCGIATPGVHLKRSKLLAESHGDTDASEPGAAPDPATMPPPGPAGQGGAQNRPQHTPR